MRRILYAAGGLVLVLAIAATALWMARVPLAERWLDARLERAGFPDAEFEIAALGWRRLEIEPAALGPAPAPRVERIVAEFLPLRLLRGDVTHVEVTVRGLEATVAPAPEGLALAGMARDGGEAEAASPTAGEATALLGAVPTLALRDARVTLESPVGRWVATLDADVEGGPRGPVTARIDAGIRNNRLVVDGALSARYDGTRIEGSMRLRENDGFEVELRGRLVDPLGTARARLSWRVDMPAAADLPWPFLPGAPPSAGRIALTGGARGQVVAERVPRTPAEWIDALVAGGWGGDYRLEANGLAMNARFGGLTAEAGGEWQSADERLRFTAAGDGELRIDDIAEPLWSRLSPPAAAVPYLAGPVRLRWEAGEWLQLRGRSDGGVEAIALPRLRLDWPQRAGAATLQASARAGIAADGAIAGFAVTGASLDVGGLRLGATRLERLALVGGVEDVLGAPSGELDLSLDLPAVARGAVTAADVALRLPLRLDSEAGALRIGLREPGLVRAAELALPGGLRSAGEVAGEIREASLRPSGEAAGYRGVVDLAPVRFEAADGPAGAGAVEVGPGTITARGAPGAPGPFELRLDRIALPDSALLAEGVRAVLRPAAFERWLTGAVARIADTGAAGRFAPVTVSGRVERRADGWVIAGEGRAGDGAVPFRIRGRATISGRAGQLALDVPTMRFTPGGLQPAGLAPMLARFEQVEGEAGGSLQLNWDGADLQGDAVGRVADLDFTVGPARVRGLAGTVRLAELRPPRTGEPQRLEAEAIDAGLRIEQPTLEFSLEGGGGRRGVVHVRAAEGRVVDGRVAVRDWRFDPFAQVLDPTVEVERISLGGLLDRLSIEGLEGDGTLSGALPVSIAPAGFAVRNGRLRGVDGTLRYRSARAEAVLADADRSVELMLRALEDFRYEQIEVGVRRALEGESRIDIRMQGRNPDVLEGHPFHFNIALTGDVQPLLDALARGRELTDELIERHLRMQQGP